MFVNGELVCLYRQFAISKTKTILYFVDNNYQTDKVVVGGQFITSHHQ